ncbi:dihydropyrimidinase [Desulfitibacter alkalitolerans]|uniref:dihydropyrimidinase n=1 Tax=Desulfitibacter alkalitolerans TaxID=264641 RepID=UPI00048030DE|nr:dihydropyrimidinase [Desulfitibacter alkalitolerans]
MSILIKNGTVLTATDEYKADILVEGEKIVTIGTNLNAKAEEIVDATGKYVFPGGVDEHVHYASFGSLGYDTTHAAVVAGTTTIADFVPQPQGAGLKESVLMHIENQTKGKASVDYVLHGLIMDARPEVFEEIPTMPEIGVASVKLFMAYKGTPYYVADDAIFNALRLAKDAGVTIMVHAENADIIDVLTKELVEQGKTDPKYLAEARPVLTEAEATSRAIYLARMADAPIFVVHVTCKLAMEVIRDAYRKGIPAYGETCTHYLVLTEENLAKPNFEGAKYVCMPPLRSQENLDAMWEALRNNWLLAVGSDHCALDGGFEKAKRKGMGDFSKIPPGSPGVENRLAIVWTYGVEKGKISRQRFVEVCCTAPAKICGIYPQKGQIAIGSDADIVIFDPNWKGTISVKNSLHGVDYNAYEGFEQIGRPEKVYLRGKLTAENGEFVGQFGQGQQVKAQPFGLCYEGVK